MPALVPEPTYVNLTDYRTEAPSTCYEPESRPWWYLDSHRSSKGRCAHRYPNEPARTFKPLTRRFNPTDVPPIWIYAPVKPRSGSACIGYSRMADASVICEPDVPKAVRYPFWHAQHVGAKDPRRYSRKVQNLTRNLVWSSKVTSITWHRPVFAWWGEEWLRNVS